MGAPIYIAREAAGFDEQIDILMRVGALPLAGAVVWLSLIVLIDWYGRREPRRRITEEQYAAAIEGLPAAELVITHCPPVGINDGADPSHVGIAALRRWVDRHRPRWLLHGHTYNNPVQSFHGGTEVLYTYGYVALELDL
ncbi:hypothetical protein ACNQR7_31220 [Mycolicibacterium senegalense]|uniref:hypothetical protein n=1 Tax=Mycolicibacterium senegalense TaxID=1796 RepID=UPI003AAD87B8